jgi:hypothetical protein
MRTSLGAQRLFLARALVLALAGCGAHASTPAPAAPDFTPIAGEAPPPHAALYADCLADAAAHQQVRAANDPDTHLLLFTCTGEPARAFYDALDGWDGSTFDRDGRTYRATSRVQHDLFGIDYCDTDGTDHECVITLNVGEFLSAGGRSGS